MMNIASMIDHTLLKPETTKAQIEKLVEEAKNMNLHLYVSIRHG